MSHSLKIAGLQSSELNFHDPIAIKYWLIRPLKLDTIAQFAPNPVEPLLLLFLLYDSVSFWALQEEKAIVQKTAILVFWNSSKTIERENGRSLKRGCLQAFFFLERLGNLLSTFVQYTDCIGRSTMEADHTFHQVNSVWVGSNRCWEKTMISPKTILPMKNVLSAGRHLQEV